MSTSMLTEADPGFAKVGRPLAKEN